MDSSRSEPIISVIMANLNGANFIAAAVRSVLRQSERALELILSDDGSSDDSLARAMAEADGDPRLVVLRHGVRGGPAAARNRALAIARGRWVAVVDNDDYIHPERLQRLIRAAEADGAEIAADDLLTFYESGARAPHPHLRGALAKAATWIDAAAYAEANVLMAGGAQLGYLKPIFRRVGPGGATPRYDESLTIAEDSDLVQRLLIGGWRLRLYPELGYFYRKHTASVSHRLKPEQVDAMLAAHARLAPGDDARLRRALARQRAALLDTHAFVSMIAALKARRFGAAAGFALKRPAVLPMLGEPLKARLFPNKPRPLAPTPPRIVLISRQRIAGATTGSSAYVLAIAGALRDAGFVIDFIGASPKIFGRWAMLRLRPELDVFERFLVHGGVRIGPLLLARDPRVWLASALAVAQRGLDRLGLGAIQLSRPAEYAQGAPASRADQLYVARHAGVGVEAVLCDYGFTAPLAAFALAPKAPALVIMHDLMSARVTDLLAEQVSAGVLALTAAEEFRLFGLAEAVIAIQPDEAAKVRTALPHSRVVLAPHAVKTVAAPQPGQDDVLLFVGSNTAPNIVGLAWFFREAWPAIRAARPRAQLMVAGSVGRGLDAPAPEGVKMLGVVGDLAPLYRDAGVVISPLYTGSGLKIKLVEALAAGKALVGTSVTAQGVEAIVAGKMALHDDGPGFAAAAIALLGDADARRKLGAAALDCAEAHFSARACFSELIGYVRAGANSAAPVAAP